MWSIPGLKAAGIVSATATKDEETGVSAAEHPPWELARLLAVLTTLRDRPRLFTPHCARFTAVPSRARVISSRCRKGVNDTYSGFLESRTVTCDDDQVVDKSSDRNQAVFNWRDPARAAKLCEQLFPRLSSIGRTRSTHASGEIPSAVAIISANGRCNTIGAPSPRHIGRANLRGPSDTLPADSPRRVPDDLYRPFIGLCQFTGILWDTLGWGQNHSHSIVPGGLLVTS